MGRYHENRLEESKDNINTVSTCGESPPTRRKRHERQQKWQNRENPAERGFRRNKIRGSTEPVSGDCG